MEIIKHGNTYRKFECHECGCVFHYTERDVGNFILGYSIIPCPECETGKNIINFEQEV